MKKILPLFLLLISLYNVAQTRYFEEVFEDVLIETDIIYGTNMNYLPYLVFGSTLEQDLEMDVYTPAGDDLAERPVVITAHTGSFLPIITNGTTTGSRNDSSMVEIANQLTKRGFVVVNIDYRLGWNPISDLRSVRTGTLINAAYRGLQDLRTCVRFLRKSYEEGNPYGIDTSRIVAMGQGTGGYGSYAATCLDKIEEIQLEKFTFINEDGIIAPFVDPDVSGDLYGLGYPDPEQDNGFIETDTSSSQYGNFITLNKPNHIGYSSEIHLGFSCGGALPSIEWLDEKSKPLIACQSVIDPNTPFYSGILVVPTTEEEVVEVDGAGATMPAVNASGANDVLLDQYFLVDDYSNVIREYANNTPGLEGQEHVWPIVSDTVSAPWEWWNPDDFEADLHLDNLMQNPTMSKEKALAYIDTVVNFFIPRAVVALDLPVDGLEFWAVGLEEIEGNTNISFYPNPAHTNILIGSENQEIIQTIEIYDIKGRLLTTYTDIQQPQYIFSREGMNNGTYLLKVFTNQGISTHKLLLK